MVFPSTAEHLAGYWKIRNISKTQENSCSLVKFAVISQFKFPLVIALLLIVSGCFKILFWIRIWTSSLLFLLFTMFLVLLSLFCFILKKKRKLSYNTITIYYILLMPNESTERASFERCFRRDFYRSLLRNHKRNTLHSNLHYYEQSSI